MPRRSKPSITPRRLSADHRRREQEDRPDANPERVVQQLSERGLVPEQWGGDTIVVQISALQGTGIDDLLEQLLIVAEVEELRASPRAVPAAACSKPSSKWAVARWRRSSWRAARCAS